MVQNCLAGQKQPQPANARAATCKVERSLPTAKGANSSLTVPESSQTQLVVTSLRATCEMPGVGSIHFGSLQQCWTHWTTHHIRQDKCKRCMPPARAKVKLAIQTSSEPQARASARETKPLFRHLITSVKGLSAASRLSAPGLELLRMADTSNSRD